MPSVRKMVVVILVSWKMKKLKESYANTTDLATNIKHALGSMRSFVASTGAGANPRTKLRLT